MCPRCEGIMKDSSISNVGEHFSACGSHLSKNENNSHPFINSYKTVKIVRQIDNAHFHIKD